MVLFLFKGQGLSLLLNEAINTQKRLKPKFEPQGNFYRRSFFWVSISFLMRLKLKFEPHQMKGEGSKTNPIK